MTWLETVGNLVTTGALCTWAIYDIYRRWNDPTQANIGRSSAEQSIAEHEGAFLPGVQALQHNGNGWQTTTITVNHGGPGALTLHDLLGLRGHLDPEHPQIVDFLEHLHQIQGLQMAGGHRSNRALYRIAQAGPQDFTEADYEMLSALDEGTTRRRRPVSETMLASLPTHMHVSSHKGHQDESEEERSCSICLEAFQDRETVKTLPCLHHFHASCIEEWLKRQGQEVSCPVCKTPVFDGQY